VAVDGHIAFQDTPSPHLGACAAPLKLTAYGRAPLRLRHTSRWRRARLGHDLAHHLVTMCSRKQVTRTLDGDRCAL